MVRSPTISSPTRLVYILFASVIPGAIRVELAQSCDQISSPPFVCDEEQSLTYKREGGQFSSTCAGSSLLDCSRCLKLTVYCHDNFFINLSGFWQPPLRVIWRCMMSDNSYTESVYMHRNYSNENLVIPAPNHYSNCMFGACYSTLAGWTYIANLTNCKILQPNTTIVKSSLESTVEVVISTDKILQPNTTIFKLSLESTVEAGLESVMKTMSPTETSHGKSKLSTVIDSVPLTTETTQQLATTQCQYQAYVGGIIGISAVAIVVVLILLIIITALVIKVKKYQLQLQDVSKPDAKNVDAQNDVEINQNKHKFITKSDQNSKGKSEMNMVDCLAYGTVSEISKPHGASISETGTGVYEAI